MGVYSWDAGAGDWSDPGDWVGGLPNGDAADVTIANPGAYAVTIGAAEHFTADSVTLANAGAALDLAGTLALSGTLAAFDLASGTLALGGTLAGGTLTVAQGARLTDDGGGLSGTSYDFQFGSDLYLNGDALTLGGGGTFEGDAQGGTLDLTGPVQLRYTGASGTTLTITGTATQENAGIVLDSDHGGGASVLAIAAGATFVGGNLGGFFSDVFIGIYGYQSGLMVNAGLFEEVNQSVMAVDAAFSNASTGTVLAASGGLLQFDGNLANAGTLIATSGGYLVANEAITGTGMLLDDGGVLALFGSVAAGETVSLAGTGNTLVLGGSDDQVEGFTLGDAIDLYGLTWTSFTYVAGVGLEVSGNGITDTIDLAGSFNVGNFALSEVPNGGRSNVHNNTQINFVENNGIGGAAVTLLPGMPEVTISAALNTSGIVGTYAMTVYGARQVDMVAAAVFAPAGANVTVLNMALIDTDTSGSFNAGIVLGSAGTVENAGTMISAAGVEVFGAAAGAYVENTGIMAATLGAGIYLQADGAALNLGTLRAALDGLQLAGGGYGYNAGAMTATNGMVLGGGAGGYAYNAGGITAASVGMDLLSFDTAVNAGTIIAGTAGILLQAGLGAQPPDYRMIAYNYGLISAASGIVLANGVGGYVYNSGSIVAARNGIDLASGLAVNLGTIGAGGAGISLSSGQGYNYGRISAVNGILGGNYAYNAGGITATGDGLAILAPGSAANAGTIFAGSAGLYLGSGGIAYNYGFLSAAIGIAMAGGGTVIEDGVIEGARYAVSFAPGFADRLVIDPGASISGSVSGGGGVLELAAGGPAGAISAGQFGDFGTIQVDAGALWTISGSFAAALVNDGRIQDSKTGPVTIGGPVSGTGTMALAKGELTLNGGVAARQTIAFSGTGETLALGDPAACLGKIEKFAIGDTIDLTGVSLAAITSTHFAGGVLTLGGASGSIALSFVNPAKFGGDVFLLTAEGAGTAITLGKAKGMALLAPAAAGAYAWLPVPGMAYAPAPPATVSSAVSAGWLMNYPRSDRLLPVVTLHP
jgi:hypothetical protein